MFKIVSWNIQHGKGHDGVVDIWRIAKTLKKLDADIYTIQDVDRESSRSGRIDQAKILEEKLEMPGFFTPISRVRDGSYGILSLTKWPVKNHTNVILTDSQQNNSFHMLEMQINDIPFNLVNLHAPLHNSQTYWKRFMQYIPSRAILSGDFNLPLYDDRIINFRKKYKSKIGLKKNNL